MELSTLTALDDGIKREVHVLSKAGIETFESCEGGDDHAFAEPTVCFHGDHSEGYRAVTVALQNGLQPVHLKRVWIIIDVKGVGPHWEMVFAHNN